MRGRHEQRTFSTLCFIPAIYMLIAVLCSVMVLVGVTTIRFQNPMEGILFLPLFMAQSAAEIVSPHQVSNAALQKLNPTTDEMQIQILRMVNRSGEGRQRLLFTFVFCLVFTVSAIGVFLKRTWAIHLGQMGLGIGAIAILIAYVMTPRVYFHVGLSDDSVYILSIISSITMLLILLARGRPSAELPRDDLNEQTAA